MTQVRVRSALPLSIVRDGAEVVVEETDDVKTMIADGKLTVIARYPDVDGEPVLGEFDATHGEADPEPGDPDFDEYSSTFDAELDAPLPPPERKRRRGD